MTLKEWLIKRRNNGCPNHGYYITSSLVRYSGYCRICNKFWRLRRHIEMANMPLYWFYFEPKENSGQSI